jgi:hypothetical protein
MRTEKIEEDRRRKEKMKMDKEKAEREAREW